MFTPVITIVTAIITDVVFLNSLYFIFLPPMNYFILCFCYLLLLKNPRTFTVFISQILSDTSIRFCSGICVLLMFFIIQSSVFSFFNCITACFFLQYFPVIFSVSHFYNYWYYSISSILNNWLYFAVRSPLHGAPVLIYPVFKATAKSAIVVSSLSPER